MIKEFNLGWLTSCSPLYSSKLPDWKHHDALLRKLVSEGNIKIHVPVPQAGATSQMHKLLYEKDDRQLYHTLRGLGMIWYEDLNPVDEVSNTLDALVLDGVAVFQEVELKDKVLTSEDQYNYIDSLICSMLSKKKKVFLIDNDNVCARVFLEEDDNSLRKFFLKYKDSEYLYVLSPYDQSETLGIPKERTRHIPFEVDRTTLKPIILDGNSREYLLRYVGNNYYKSETHVPVFEKLGHLGKVHVNGKFWSKEIQESSPHVTYGPSISLSHDNLLNVYGDSILGASGFSKMHDKSLYILRWKEFLIGGTYIILDESPYLSPLLPPQDYTFEKIRESSIEELRDYIAYVKGNYLQLVESQREVALEFFSVDRWYKVWCDLLGI